MDSREKDRGRGAEKEGEHCQWARERHREIKRERDSEEMVEKF